MGDLFGKREKGLVSIVVALYNREAYIEETLDSLKNQTYKNLEVIVINDDCTDNSEKVVKTWYENNKNVFKNFIYLKLPRNRDEEWANNIGFCLTSGEFIGLQCSDDVSDKKRIEREIEFLSQHTETAAVAAKYLGFTDKIENAVDNVTWLSYNREEIERNYKDLVHCVSTAAILFRSNILEDMIGFKKAYFGANDWYFIVELTQHDYIIDNLDEVLFYCRSHKGQKNVVMKNQNYIKEKMRQITGRVSVVLPIYRKENNILESLKTVFNQTYDDIEIVIVDDLGDEATESAIKNFYLQNKNNKIKDFVYFKLPKKIGYPWVYNIGAYLSLGEYIVFHGDNGKSNPCKLEKQVEFLNSNPEYDVVGTNTDRKNNCIKYGEEINISYAVNYTSCVDIFTIMMRTKVINITGGLNENIARKEDFEYINRIIEKGFKVQNLKEVLYYVNN